MSAIRAALALAPALLLLGCSGNDSPTPAQLALRACALFQRISNPGAEEADRRQQLEEAVLQVTEAARLNESLLPLKEALLSLRDAYAGHGFTNLLPQESGIPAAVQRGCTAAGQAP